MIRVACYIDGFNLYHAIDNLSRASRGAQNYLKWVSLRPLMEVFIDKKVHEIAAVKYFSAYATWKPGPYARHIEFVNALHHSGVSVILGRFKEKDIYCKNCGTMSKGHEEKESDVNIATHMMCDAYEDIFDIAFLVSRDSDLAGPMRVLRAKFPAKKIKVIAPPLRRHSKELGALADSRAEIKEAHLKMCLLPKDAYDGNGKRLFVRPPEYDPPA